MFLSLTLANVPRTMTSWLALRDPYELNSAGATPLDLRYLPASVPSAKDPAGDMWSVVMESPSFARHLALTMFLLSGSSSMSSKNGGLRMYVEPSSHLNRGDFSQGTASHLAEPLKMSLYFET